MNQEGHLSEWNAVLDKLENEIAIESESIYEIGKRIGGRGDGEVYKYHHKLLNYDLLTNKQLLILKEVRN